MNPIARRLLGAAATAVARKLLPDAVPNNLGSALALRSDATLAPLNRTNFLPTVRPQTLDAPPSAPPASRRRRRIVIVEETTWRS